MRLLVKFFSALSSRQNKTIALATRSSTAGDLVKAAKAFAAPRPFVQCRPANHFPGTFQQDLQQLQRLLPYSNSQAPAAHFDRIERNLKGSKP